MRTLKEERRKSLELLFKQETGEKAGDILKYVEWLEATCAQVKIENMMYQCDFGALGGVTPENLKFAHDTLAHHNLWRRDNEGIYDMPDPKEVGQAIDLAITVLKTALEKSSL